MAAVARADALAARLGGLTVDRAGWAGAARSAAADRLVAMGLPFRRDEYWRYTDPARFNAPETGIGIPVPDPETLAVFAGLRRARMVFTGGAFDAAASDMAAIPGLEAESLSGAAGADIHWARDLLGVLEAQGQQPVARPFAALATAYARDGAVLRATAVTTRAVELVSVDNAAGSAPILQHVVKVEAGASLTVLETDATCGRSVSVLEVDVAPGGSFHHIRVQAAGADRAAATHIFLRLGASARAKSFTLSADGRLTRNEAVIALAGDHASAHVAGAALGHGALHHDDTVFVTHAGRHCESRQVFKKVLGGGATGVFQGKILVKPGAQKTDGYQISQSLLLDEGSQFLAKPELEIYADDVKCSHGSTSGAIDDTALFYLRSRGVPLQQARSFLVLAFLADAVAEIADPAIAGAINARIARLLGIDAEE
jgi:Fe-S cluster assembly protein SufD